MDAWAWSKQIDTLLGEMNGDRRLLIVGTGTRDLAAELAGRHGLTLCEVNGLVRSGAFIVTTDQEARGGSIDG